MKKKKILFVSAVLVMITFTTVSLANQDGGTNYPELTVDSVEALSNCEHAGYNLNSYCTASEGDNCYYGEFVAKDCTRIVCTA